MTDFDAHLDDAAADMPPLLAAPAAAPRHAQVNVTYAGHNGDLRDPVPENTTTEDLRRIVQEALQADGGVRGIPAQRQPDLTNFQVERFAPTAEVPYVRFTLRPKTAFGGRG